MSFASVSLPFRFEHNLLLFTASLPGGESLNLTLDTCAWPHVVRTELAASQGWLTGQSSLSEGAAGSQTTAEALIPLLQLGPLALSCLEALCDPLQGPLPIDVMLGAPLLEQYVVEINYPGLLLTLHPAKSWQCPPALPGREVLPLELLDPGIPCLRDGLRLNGTIIPVALLDTGNNASLVLSPQLAQCLGLEAEQTVSGGGFGGQELSFGSLTIAELSLGGRIWHDVQAVILPPQASPLLARPDTALIGNGLLQEHVVTWAASAIGPHYWILERKPYENIV